MTSRRGEAADRSDATRPLAGVRIIEISSFVAVPLAGMTLGQLGAEVTRVDPVGGAADYRRWPVTEAGDSIYWAGLNKGKRSAAIDVRSPEGQALIQRLVVDAGILITNVAGRQWHSYETLAESRPDLIHVEVSGRADGGTGVDYTVNAGIGFPMVTGPVGLDAPVNHVLPAWDVACGLYTALAVTTALRHRDATGEGGRISIPLENVALATAGNLSFFTEVMVNGVARERIGNSIFGQYGQQFVSSDGAAFMIVALTGRHFRDLTEVTGTAKAVAALGNALDADFTDEGDRYRHRDALTGLFTVWFTDHTGEEVSAALSATSILWERYRSFADVVADPKVTANPLFTELDQPRIGRHLAAGLPLSIDGVYPPAVAAPELGDDTVCRASGTSGVDRGRDRAARRIGNRGMSALLELLDVRAGDTGDAWVGPASGPEGKRAFGGQFMAQSLAAAAKSVDAEKLPTNMHLQFLRGGEAGDDVQYAVVPVFDGRTTAARRVESSQAGRLLTTASVSFAAALAGPEHGRVDVAGAHPDSLPQTGPVGPAPSMPLEEIDIRVDDDRRRRRVRPTAVVAGEGTDPRRTPAAHGDCGLRHRRLHDRPGACRARALDDGSHPPQWDDRFIDLVSPPGPCRRVESPRVPVARRGPRPWGGHRQPDRCRRGDRRHPGSGGPDCGTGASGVAIGHPEFVCAAASRAG